LSIILDIVVSHAYYVWIGLANRSIIGGIMPWSKENKKKYLHTEKGRKVRKEYQRKRYRTLPGRTSGLLTHTKMRSKAKQLPFDLDYDWLYSKIEAGVCESTGCEFDLESIESTPLSPSIDRIDSSKGYTKDNCRVVIWGYNVAKSSWSDYHVYLWAKPFIERYEKEIGL
jgi:hypothetical protein